MVFFLRLNALRMFLHLVRVGHERVDPYAKPAFVHQVFDFRVPVIFPKV